jgi:NAD(P)-dependent dehydrogenase (short-subunit alcohol dehydrogenase family)
VSRARFDGRAVVVTGGASGIGREMARQFSGDGRAAAGCDRQHHVGQRADRARVRGVQRREGRPHQPDARHRRGVRPHGIRANAAAPASIRTPIWDERVTIDPEIFERVAQRYPLGRIGEPDDVARAALFLASDDAAWITGIVLPVDGGLLAGNMRMTRELLGEGGTEVFGEALPGGSR